jgi:hypothetical protein
MIAEGEDRNKRAFDNAELFDFGGGPALVRERGRTRLTP